ncbi:flagellar hook-length control protein FliK [Peredibacter sp. HCB2-198]|uniref:flagellar hook-length control protein FliK n=1 Tax=Peredibacter sp. HCB2-198 TaxID=3383025 RepID=UPI0038B58E46
MIQAPQSKPIETKAQRADVSNKAQKDANVAEGTLEAQIFVSELEASMADTAEVRPVEVTAEQMLEMPSSLINQSGSVESTSPKIFDPAMTKGVEKLNHPKNSEVSPEVQKLDAEVLKLVQAGKIEVPVEAQLQEAVEVKEEIAKAMLKTPQVAEGAKPVATGRAPAIDFAKSEVDPQLMNMEDFVAQKNLATKKAVPNAYGMKTLPAQHQKVALESGLKQTQIVKEAALPEAGSSSVNSQQFILNMMNEQKGAPVLNETQAAPKVFDMNQVKTSNPDQIINQITDYVVQAKAAKEPTVNMRVNHEELGMIDITVSKVGANHESIAVNIGTHSVDGKNFFQQNSKDLFSHLTTAGLNVADLKVETPTQTAKNDFDFGSQSGRNQSGADKQFGSEQNQRRHESERRQDLWKLLNQEAA